MADQGLQGWSDDPFRLHEARYFSAGRPTSLVRDDGKESYDEPPSGTSGSLPAGLTATQHQEPPGWPGQQPPLRPPDGDYRPDLGADQHRQALPPGRHRTRNTLFASIAGLVLLVIGVAIGAATANKSKSAPAPTVTVTAAAAVPTVTVTRAAAAAAAVTVTVTATPAAASPPPPPAGTQIGTWSGTGNQVTPAFNAPASGDYIVRWTFSGNDADGSAGGDNFIISATDSSAEALGLPNAIATSGSGSTEVTGASGVETFNVQATGSWTITVTSAS